MMFIMVMLHSDIHYGLCRIMLFIKGYIALWHSSMVHLLMALSHCNIHRGLRWIETFHHCTFLIGFYALRQSSRVMLNFGIHKGIHDCTFLNGFSALVIHQELCWISTFIKEYIGLQHLSIVMLDCDIIKGYITLQH